MGFLNKSWPVILQAASLVLVSSLANAGANIRIRTATDTHQCLMVQGSSKKAGAQILKSKCGSSLAQQYYAKDFADGSYTLQNINSGLCLQVVGGSRADSASMEQANCDSSSVNQHFTPLYTTSSSYNLVAQMDGRCLYIENSTTSNLRKALCDSTALIHRYRLEVMSGSLNLPTVPTDTVITPVSGASLPSRLHGVNLSGGESGDLGSVYGWGYAYPSNDLIDYFASTKMTTIRLPFKSSRLQPQLGGPLDRTELARIDAVVQYARKKGLYVILDPHDYGKMMDGNKNEQFIGSDAMPAAYFANFWSRLARVYMKQTNVMFNIMNEPYNQTATQWQSSAIAAVSAIRIAGAKQYVIIPGSSWTGAHSWVGSQNGAAWEGFREQKYMMDVHQYLDSDSSGTHEDCVSGSGASRLVAVTNWSRQYANKPLFVGEFGWSRNDNCTGEARAMMDHISDNSDVFYGYTYFGAFWYAGFMSINSDNYGKSNQSDAPQLKLMAPYL